MSDQIPSYETVRERLAKLTNAQLLALAAGSGVSYHTILKIKNGTTTNPGIDTTRKFWSVVPAIERGWNGIDRRSKARV